jgi:hypothetical protein
LRGTSGGLLPAQQRIVLVAGLQPGEKPGLRRLLLQEFEFALSLPPDTEAITRRPASRSESSLSTSPPPKYSKHV